MLPHAATRCRDKLNSSLSRASATHYSTMQQTATRCNTLQQAATCCRDKMDSSLPRSVVQRTSERASKQARERERVRERAHASETLRERETEGERERTYLTEKRDKIRHYRSASFKKFLALPKTKLNGKKWRGWEQFLQKKRESSVQLAHNIPRFSSWDL